MTKPKQTESLQSLQLFIDPYMPSDEEAKERNQCIRELIGNPDKIAELEKSITFKVDMIPFG